MLKSYIKHVIHSLEQLCGSHRLIINEDIESLDIDPNDVYFFNLSSNPIKILFLQKKFFYFRECREHKDFNSFVLESLDKFYHIATQPIRKDNFEQKIPIKQSFSSDYISCFKKYIDLCIKKYNFLNRIKALSYTLEQINFSIWDGNYFVSQEVLSKIGLHGFPYKFREILPLFLVYMRSGTHGWKGKIGTYDCYNACRSIGSAKVAELLGMKDIYASAKLIKLKVGNKEEIGVLSDKASGIRALDTDALPSPSLQRQLSNLALIDVLCYQPDHWINNYNIISDKEGMAIDVCAFDNDNSKTFYSFGGINLSCYHGGCSFINNEGLIAMPHIDKNIAENLLSLSYSDIKEVLSPYLNKLQLLAIGYRLYLLKKYIKKTSIVRQNFLLSSSDFNSSTLADELSGKYGHTYLFQYAHKQSN